MMKTSESFFPTRTHLKSRDNHREHVVNLIRPKRIDSPDSKVPTEPVNIFQDRANPAFRQAAASCGLRPVGGEALFKKMSQNTKERAQELKKMSKRSNRDNTIRNIVSSNGSRFRRERPDHDDPNELLPLKSVTENNKNQDHSIEVFDQPYRSHASYDPSDSLLRGRKSTMGTKSGLRSQNPARPKSSKTLKAAEWASSQSKQYHDKTALLNEINYNRPLVEKYGDQYFEYILRNRYEQDFKPPAYIYLLSNKKFADTRVISKIKQYRPDIRERQMLMLRGSKVRPTYN